MEGKDISKVLSWDKESENNLIRSFWHCVGHIKDIPNNNDFFKITFLI